MQGRLENQIKTEKKIDALLADMPSECTKYYLNFSANKEFRSCLGYIQKIKRFLLWYGKKHKVKMKDIDFNSITDTDIANYMKYCETKETSDGVEYTSFSYRKQIWSILNSFFEYLDKKRWIDGNPVRFVEYPKKKDRVEHIFLSKDDLDKMISCIESEIAILQANNEDDKWKVRDLAILYTFIFTGMRESALCEIDVDKINLEENVLEVIDKEHKKNTYAISPKLKEVLMDWMKCREKILGKESNDSLFISNRKERINQGTVRYIIRTYSENALGQKVSPHRLRAAYGNIIYQQTRDIELTSRAMKHENISTTRIYMDDNEKMVNNKVADILGNMF